MSTAIRYQELDFPTDSSQVAKYWTPHAASPTNFPGSEESLPKVQHVLAMFCYEQPASTVGQFVSRLTDGLAQSRTRVHVFSRHAFDLLAPGVSIHPVGECSGRDLLESVHEFTRRACNAYLRQFQNSSAQITLMGHEWSAIPAVSLLHGIKNLGTIVSLHSLERQRSGLGSELSKWIEETELSGLREARSILIHEPATAEVARHCLPECDKRIVDAWPRIPMEHFQFDGDPAEVKARFEVGPIDPTILYIGDLRQSYGPDLLIKAMPTVLRKHPQARCIFVGDGELLWPLRVYSRYLLLDHAVRLAGHVGDESLYELIHSVDMVVVPSRDSTPWWPIEAAWVAHRPVVATAEAAPLLLEAEKDCVIVEADETDLAAGIDRLLSEPEIGRVTASRGRAKLEERFGDDELIAQIEAVMGVERSPEKSPCRAGV